MLLLLLIPKVLTTAAGIVSCFPVPNVVIRGFPCVEKWQSTITANCSTIILLPNTACLTPILVKV